MPALFWLAKFFSNPIILASLPEAWHPLVKRFLEDQAGVAEKKAAALQARTAGAIADGAKRAEALREASKKISDITARD